MGPKFNAVTRIVILQRKVLENMNFKPREFHPNPLLKLDHVLKFEDTILTEYTFN